MTLSSLFVPFGIALLPWLGSECPSCKPDNLCGPHRQAEQKEVVEARATLHGKDAAAKRAALEALAALVETHTNAPGRAAAETIAIALKDDSFELRAKAAGLLGKGQHPDAAVRALTDALDDIREEVARLGRGNGARGGGAPSIVSEAGTSYVQAVADSLAGLPDDRAVDGLADLLKQLEPGAPDGVVIPVVRALAKLGSRNALRAIVQRFIAAEGSHSKSRNNNNNNGGGGTSGGSGGGVGGGASGSGGRGGFGGGGRGGGNRDANGFREHGGSEEQRQALHDALHQVAQEKKLDGAPDYSPRVAQEWQDWFDAHAGKFPNRLGRVSGAPVEAAAPAKH